MLKIADRRTCWLLVLSLFVVLAPSLSMAQTSATGALSGTVTDPTGAVVANVKVTATNTGTGQERTVTTGADGAYKINLLQPGNYRVSFEATGFNAQAVPSTTVNVTETTVLDGRLTVGSQTQAITVQGEAVAVQTTDATVGTLLAGKTIADLPLTSRNYTNLLGLSAGSNAAVYDAANLGKGSQDIAVNGGSTNQNNYQMDGVSVDDPSSGGTTLDAGFGAGIGIVNPDAIQEFKIQTSLFDAGYGRKPGANVNVVTKTGTNEFHGAAFEFFRNTIFNANDFFRNQSPPVSGVPNNSRQVLNQNQYGGVIGGPIKKDKLFFFTSYQETWQKNGIAAQGFAAYTLPPIPTGSRSAAGFQAALGAAFCPSGTSGTFPGYGKTGGVQVACDGSNINPVALNVLQLKNPDGSYYIPSSGTGGYVPTTASIPASYREHQALENVDYVISAKNTLSFKWFYDQNPTQIPFGCASNATIGSALSTCLPDTAGHTVYKEQTGMVKLTSILSNTVVNEARISFLRTDAQLFADVPFTDTQVGITPIVPSINNLDQIIISQNGFTAGTNYVLANVYKYSTAEIYGDQISWSHGKQTFRFGAEGERDQINSGVIGDSIAALTFQTFQDFLLGLPGCSPAQVAAGCSPTNAFPGTNGSSSSNISNSGNFATLGGPKGPARVNFLQSDFAAFIQDDIKFKPRFTLNMGLRWDFDGWVTSQSGELGNVWPSLVNTVPIPGNSPTCPNASLPAGTACTPGTLAGFVVPSNYNPAANPIPPVGGLTVNSLKFGTRNGIPLHDFAPRLGFAWQPTESDRFVVRGGAGYFFERLNTGNAATTYFIGQPNDVLIGRSGPANYFSTFAQPVPPTTLAWQDRWVNFATGASSNLAQYVQQEHYLTPLVYEWNLNAQYEFLPTWVLELGYVGSHGIHLAVGNQEINQAMLVGNPLGNNIYNAPGIAAGLVTTNTAANASLRVPFLGFAPGGLISGSTDGDDKFNSLQVTVRKRLSHGLSMQAAYTWSKSLATGTMQINDANNHGTQYGPNPFYHPQRLAINYSWDLPLGHAEGLQGKLTNGWALSGVTIIQDGVPLTVSDSRGGTVYGFGPGTPETATAEFCAGGTAYNAASSGSDKQRLGGANGGPGWFNPATFKSTCTEPAIGSDGSTGYGNSPIGVILGPGQFNWDMSLTKMTTVGGIHEDARLQFRAEFFNTFNHAQFNTPVVNVAASNFGSIISTSVNPRLIQFALKYIF